MKNLIVHGHRGSRGTNPENTIPSFQDAALAKAEFVEFDVQFCKGKKLVVFHDTTISDRICRDAKGEKLKTPIRLQDLSFSDLQAFDCGTPEAKIPSFEELILWKLKVAPAMKLNVEIKFHAKEDTHTDPEELAHAVVSLLKQYTLMEESLVQSFDFDVVRSLRKLDSKLRLSCLFEHEADFAVEAVQNKAQVAAVHHKLLTAENVKRCQEAGLEVLPWTVNEEEDWIRMVDIGVRSIITDFPKRLKEFNFI